MRVSPLSTIALEALETHDRRLMRGNLHVELRQDPVPFG